MTDFASLVTENINEKTKHIDTADTLSQLKMMNDEDKTVACAVEKALPQIAAAVDEISRRLKKGGRLFYVGAGTSGRLGILDASECPPTFGVSPDMVQGVIAGGEAAVFRSQEGAEDRCQKGADDLVAKKLSAADAVVGIAASGRTPYVVGALQYAAQVGAATVSLSCVKNAVISRYAHTAAIEIETGAEAITGSTRLKAGTAQKMTLNMLSTVAMIKLGKVVGNLMADVQPTNEKLKDRLNRIVMTIAECSAQEAEDALRQTGNNAKEAIRLLTGK